MVLNYLFCEFLTNFNRKQENKYNFNINYFDNNGG